MNEWNGNGNGNGMKTKKEKEHDWAQSDLTGADIRPNKTEQQGREHETEHTHERRKEAEEHEAHAQFALNPSFA